MTQVVRIWCEWDIGLERMVFTTMAVARKAADEALYHCDIYDEDMTNLAQVEDAGFIGFEWIDVVSV